MNSTASLNVARAAFVMVCTLLGISIALGQGPDQGWIGALSGLGFGLLVLGLDLCLRNFTIRGFSTGTFGLLIGLLCAWLVSLIGVFEFGVFQQNVLASEIARLCLFLGFGFVGLMLALRSKREEFSLVIPYVRFRQDSVQEAPLLIDSNILIDGRLPQICATGFLGGSFVVPRFVLDELQMLADNRDEARSLRGKRGLECLEQMKKNPQLDVEIFEQDFPDEETVDGKLTALGKTLGARILTNDANLGKVAKLQSVTILNVNELNKALRPVVAPGDELDLELVKEGKDDHQAVGYLSDGTMIVVNQAESLIGTSQAVVVAGAVQTSAGRLIFAELKGKNE
ncbi:MAG: PIN domain nuclease [Verrucomicrobiales bacterium]|nr:PIN domain nuclease [Verrucomicrobiales bacterium]